MKNWVKLIEALTILSINPKERKIIKGKPK